MRLCGDVNAVFREGVLFVDQKRDFLTAYAGWFIFVTLKNDQYREDIP